MGSSKKRTPKQFVEFFAGIGLVRCGLERTGWECVYANDFDPKKQSQYIARFGGAHFHLENVFQTDEVCGRLPESVALATASFPCVDLSLAGNWKGISGKHSSSVFGFLQCVDRIKPPRMLLLENVVGLLSSNGGKDFERLVLSLGDRGYWLDSFQLDAKFFVPQSRPRIFIVGIHEEAIDSIEWPRSARIGKNSLDWERTVASCPALRPARLLKLMKASRIRTGWFCSGMAVPDVETQRSLVKFIDLDDRQDWWDDALVEKHYKMMNDAHRVRIDSIVESGKHFVGTIYRRKRDGRTRAEVRFDGLAGCLRTPKGGSARQIVIAISEGVLRIRLMSPREYSRLQGAGDFPLVGTTNQQLFGFGDAVCVPVIEWIDQHILSPVASSLAGQRS